LTPPLSLHAWLRFDAIERLLPSRARTVLEIGAGLGSAGALLARRYDYVGLEPDGASFAIASRRVGRAGTVLQLDAESYAPGTCFDVVGAFEVLEHLEDDAGAVSGWLRHLAPGGWLLVSVPAGAHRFGPTDEMAGHFRRYDRADLASVLERAGLDEIRIVSYGFPLGYALEAGRNACARGAGPPGSMGERTASSGRWLQPPEWAGELTRLGSLPFRYLQRPFADGARGTGLVARGRKPA
jgi:SAM-dependent methyltransferase